MGVAKSARVGARVGSFCQIQPTD